MADIQRVDFLKALRTKDGLPQGSLYLFYGERFLCHEAADALQKYLLDKDHGTVHKVDGAIEDAGQTLSRLLSFSLLPGKQLYRVADSRIFQSKTVLEKIWKKAFRAFQNGRTDAARQALIDMGRLGGMSAKSTREPEAFSSISKTHWKKSFGFDKPTDSITWADSMVIGGPEKEGGAPTDLVESYVHAFDKGLPPNNILILTAETVDKRQRFFTYCKKNATTINCTIATGSNKAAIGEQMAVVQEQLKNTLDSFGKTIRPDAQKLFIERVGCHPVAIVHEAEKLALYRDDSVITKEDVLLLTCQTREDALFELTEALSERKASQSLALLGRILQSGVHGLAILATLRNFIRKLLLIRAAQLKHHQPWGRMSAQQFQNSYLPGLKENEEWTELIKGHPFAVYKNFMRAAEYSPTSLKKQLHFVHEAEFRLKSLFLPQQLILEELLIAILRTKKM